MHQHLTNRSRYCLVLALLICPLLLFAQNKNIPVRGRVTDSKDSALSNVSVIVKGTTRGTTTDANGNFKLNVPDENAVLLVTFVGYQNQELTVGQTSNFNIKLNLSNAQLADIVVVGYGSQKKVTVTGAVASVKGAELEKSPTVNLSNSLAGRLPGITAVQASGEPGYDGSSIRVRGTNTLGNTSALIVVDGVPDRVGGLERINPADVESMSVLKDASAAIYGARAANGVILITTKHGKSGKTLLSYDVNQGWAQPTRIPKMSNAQQYAEINNELVMYDQVPVAEWEQAWPQLVKNGSYTKLDGVTVNAPYQPTAIQKYIDGSDPWRYPNTDWFKTTLKTWSPQVRHNLQVNGGTENVRYLASLGYTDQDGYYKNSATGYKQYDLRLNLDVKVNKYINVSLGVNGREEYRFYPTESAGSIFRMLMRGKPTEQEVWPNGLPGPDIENGQNPIVITTNQTGYDKDKRDYVLTNGKVEIQIPGVPGLKVTGTASVDKEIQRVKDWQTPWYLYFWDGSTFEADGKTPLLTKSVRSTYSDPRLNQLDDNFLNVLLSGFINYDKTFGSHTINLMAAVTKEKNNEDNFSAYRRYFISSTIDQLFAGGDAEKNATGSAYQRARLSYFGRAAYNYKEKYLAEFLWRYDGSYLFPEHSRFGFFPGILAGWRISEENFFKNNVRFMNYLKLRASWGQMGNDQVYFRGALQEYQYLSTYPFGSYVIDGNVARTLQYTRVPNPDFTWEVANNSDVGLEGALLDSRLQFEFDYFINKRNHILIQKQGSTPASSGIANLLPPVNLGRLQNKGYEFKVSYSGEIGRDFRYTVSVNGGYAKNKILYWDEAPGVPAWQRTTGHAFGSYGVTPLAYQYDGVFSDAKDIAATKLDYSALTNELKPGDMKFKDVDGNGKIDANDRVALDKTQDPTFTGGLGINMSYKGIDCSILFQGATGGLLYFGTESGDIGNFLKYSYDHQWTVNNHSSVDPRLANRGNTYYTGGAAAVNTYFLRKSDYLRLKNVEIGYTLPANLLKKAGISNLRVYVNGLNLITWDKLKIYDPEATSSSATSSNNGQYYPQSRILSAGARITF